MIKTEKKYWQNGYKKMGGYFKTFAISFLNIGVMFCYGKGVRKSLSFYKLTK